MLGRLPLVAILAGSLIACRSASRSPSASSSGSAKPNAATSAAPVARASERLFTGACDASAAVALAGSSVVVADDEQNVLHVYDVERGGAPTSSIDLSTILGLPTKQRKDGSTTSRELDIEAAARVGSDVFFITSHGRDSRGRLRAERLKFFALRPGPSEAWPLQGSIYEALLEDLVHEPRLAAFRLSEAAELPAKAPGGLNIEGMTARVEGGVWLGFRNPVPEGRALLVPWSNPEAVVRGARAELGAPKLLDLGGRSVRALSYWRGYYLIAAGAFDARPAAALFRWNGDRELTEIAAPGLTGYNPEALLATDERDQILLLSDDGSTAIDGVECKKLKDPARKHFRGLWLRPGG